MRRFQDHRLEAIGKGTRHEPLLKFADRILKAVDADIKALDEYTASWKPVSRRNMVKKQIEEIRAAAKVAQGALGKVNAELAKTVRVPANDKSAHDAEKGRLFTSLMDICKAFRFVTLTLRRDEVLAKGQVEEISRRKFKEGFIGSDDKSQFLVGKYFFYTPKEITSYHISKPRLQHSTLPKGTGKQIDALRKWYIVDASNLILGRLATRVATILMGKHKPTYVPYIDMGDYVVVINAEKVRLSGKKEEEKVYQRYSGYQSGRKEILYPDFKKKHADDIVRLAVRRMLPKKRMGRAMLTKLKVYVGSNHPHAAQKPELLDLTKIRLGRLQYVEV